MWREYTRETPARPGWAVVSAGAALILTTSLAWVLTNHGPPGATLGSSITPAYWPISFSLPADAKPLSQWDKLPLISDPGGVVGFVAYSWGGGGPEKSVRILMRYAVYDDHEGLNIDSSPLSEDFADAEEIAIGPMTGRTFVALTAAGSRFYSAFATTDEGLGIRIDMICPPGYRNAESLFRRICESVAFQNWYGPVDPYYYLDRIALDQIRPVLESD